MTREEAFLCWLYACPGISGVRAARLIELYGSIEGIWRDLDARAIKALGNKTYEALVAHRDMRVVDRIVDDVERLGIALVRRGSVHYPPLLAQLADAPALLYVRGQQDLTDARTVGIVGARRCTRYGRTQAQRLGKELAQMGVTVVSGMARGIDTAAHAGVLDAGGRTIGVLGCGLDIAYPPENAEMMERVLDMGGSLISEYAPGMPPISGNFPQRNRILSGMCAGIVLVEAQRNSGAMITVNLALEQGREVCALPGNVDSPLSQMPLELLREGASMVCSGADVVAAMPFDAPRQMSFVMEETNGERDMEGLSDEEATIVRALKNEPLSFDELKKITAFEANQLNSLLTILEIKEIMVQLPGKMFTLCT